MHYGGRSSSESSLAVGSHQHDPKDENMINNGPMHIMTYDSCNGLIFISSVA